MKIIVNDNTLCENEPVLKAYAYHQLLTCLGYPDHAPPLADLLRRYHGLNGAWLIASPIYWEATHKDAMIMAYDKDLGLSDNESQQWFAALSDFLADDGVQLHYHNAYTWLIQLKNSPPIQSSPVHVLFQKPMMEHLLALDPTLYWSRFITENQMFFNEHPLNKMRSSACPLNGLWIWGDGTLREKTNQPLVFGDESMQVIANLLSTNTLAYESGHRYAKNSIFLFSQITEQQINDFKHQRVDWYWNNSIYHTQPLHWLRRLFSGD